MASLDSLPTELLRNIFGYLEPEDVLTDYTRGIEDGIWTIEHSQRTLSALARTCQRLNPIANEILYSRYEAVYEKPVLGYIERFDTDHLIRKQLRHVKINGDLRPRRDELGYWKSEFHSSHDDIRYAASQKRAYALEKTYCQYNSCFAVETGFKENMNHHPALLELANLFFRAENLETFCTDSLENLVSFLNPRCHRDSLKCLEFSWEDCHWDCVDPTGVDFLEFPGQVDFVKFTALKQLHVPMPLLTGRPKGRGTKWIFHPENSDLTWGTYLDTDKVLPPTLTELTLEMGPALSPALGWNYYDLLDSIIRHNRLTHLELHWKRHWLSHRWKEPSSKDFMLPIDFHEIKRRLSIRGYKLCYRIFVGNFFDYMDHDGSFTRAVDLVAKWLATYHGKAGIEMALHLVQVPRATLPRKVMNILGLQEDWLMSREAKKVLFGQKVDFHAANDFHSQAQWIPYEGGIDWEFPA
ncbi:hypothetical protein E8E13_011195 [Curvularia kusanoi]|uniref:F-box domain-containing protein n=1 Tax=Curvularia kusanoi TaxID=90978 RepID=A0A9P4TNG0_CURKU|nr:hypothetical protein E8E13_011195 [Curvularia kusanoi]